MVMTNTVHLLLPVLYLAGALERAERRDWLPYAAGAWAESAMRDASSFP
jgi:hypothetical protein